MNDNHHFLPVFYLNGFKGNNKKLIYFRKEYGSFRESAPAGIFYKPGLNDVDLGEHGYIDLENEFFREKDDRYAKAFIAIRDIYHYDLNATPLQVKADIVEFVLGLYWRVPGGLQHVIDVIETEGLLKNTLELRNNETGELYTDDEIPQIISDIKNKEENQKIFMTYFYEENVHKHNWDKLHEKFLVYQTTEPMLIGDIPYVPLNTENRLGCILDEFMIPLDHNHILIYAQKHPPFLETNVLYLFYQCIIDGVSEKIATSDKDYLKEMIEQSKTLHDRTSVIEKTMKKEEALRKFIELESFFENFDAFSDYYSNLKKGTNNKSHATTSV